MSNKAKISVISRVGWEYDDSNYYRPESGGLHPESAVLLNDMAHELCKQMNLDEARKNGGKYFLMEYGHVPFLDPEDYSEKELEEVEKFRQEHFLDESWYFKKNPKEIPDEVLANAMREFGISFFEVVEIDLIA